MEHEKEKKFLCISCLQMLEDVARVLKIRWYKIGFYYEIGIDDYKECDNCGSELLHGITKALFYENLESMADLLSKDMGGCQYCEGYERMALIHAFNNDPFDPTSRMDESIAYGTSVSDYLEERGVSYKLVSMFSKLIVCACGYGREEPHHRHNPNGGVFDPMDDIYTRDDMEDFLGLNVSDFLEFAQQYGIELTIQDFKDFHEHLSQHPMLGSEHETGKKILTVLKKHYEQGKYVTLPASVSLFRGRTRKRDSRNLYTKEEMWSPPPGLPQHGSFNTIGVSVLYVTDGLDGLPFEIHPGQDELLDVVKFELKKDLKMFDIGEFNEEFANFFNAVNEESKLLKKAYLLPNYIGSCCSFIGYDGVKYKGVHQSAGSYTNYALFNVKRDYLPVIEHGSYVPTISYELKSVGPQRGRLIDELGVPY